MSLLLILEFIHHERLAQQVLVIVSMVERWLIVHRALLCHLTVTIDAHHANLSLAQYKVLRTSCWL